MSIVLSEVGSFIALTRNRPLLVEARILRRANIKPEDLSPLLNEAGQQFGFRLEEGNLSKVIMRGLEKPNINTKVVDLEGKNRDVLIQLSSDLAGVKRFESILAVVRELEDRGIPVPHIWTTPAGEALISIPGRTGIILANVMEFFPGRDFTQKEPADEDIRQVFTYLAQIHQANVRTEIVPAYDSWSVLNLVNEYSCLTAEQRNRKVLDRILKKLKVDREVQAAIQSTVDRMGSLNLSSFQRTITHGDIQKAHVLKDDKNQYCIIDWGVTNRGPATVDLGIALAHFCTNFGDATETVRRVDLAIDAYKQVRPLPAPEEAALPLLMKATFAAYLMKSNQALNMLVRSWHDYYMIEGDYRGWEAFGRKGLAIAEKLKY